MSPIATIRRAGVSAIELAVVLPVFSLIVFGMFECGRILYVQQMINDAARRGAQVSVSDGATTSQVAAEVSRVLESLSISDPYVTVRPGLPVNPMYCRPVRVNVSVPFSEVTNLPLAKNLGPFSLDATAFELRDPFQD